MSVNRGDDINNRHKYCCNPFGDNSAKWKGDLRWVTESQAKSHPSKVLLGQKICSRCRKMLAKLPAEAQPSSSSSSGEDEEEIQGAMMDQSEMDIDDSFAFPETELGTINRSLELIGASPFKEKNMKRTTSYVLRKKQRVQEAMSAKIDAATAPHASTPKAKEISE